MVVPEPGLFTDRRDDVSNEPHVNIKKIIVTKISTIVENGENKRRYLMRKYQIKPRTNVSKTMKCDERLTGGASIKAVESKLLPLKFTFDPNLSFVRFGDGRRRALIWQ